MIKPGQVNHNLVDFTDMLPTFIEAARGTLPLNFHTNGTSFYSQLINKKNARKREWTFCSYAPNWGSFKSYTWIQDKQWKLYQTGEFYDLQKDIEEKHPIAAANLTPNAIKEKERLKRAMLKVIH